MIDQLGAQIIGVAATLIYTAIVAWLLFVIIRKMQGGLSTEQEVKA
jgi:Amt family ammonium transporter